MVVRLSPRAARTADELATSPSAPDSTPRPTSVSTGRARNSANRTATARSERSPQRGGAACCGRRAPVAIGRREDSITTAAAGSRTRRGSPARPGRPARSRNAFAASGFVDAFTTTPPYVAGTLAPAGTSIVVTLVEAAASVTYTIPASPCPARSCRRSPSRSPPSRRRSRRTSRRSRRGTRAALARLSTSRVAYFVIGTSSPAAITRRPPSRGPPARRSRPGCPSAR